MLAIGTGGTTPYVWSAPGGVVTPQNPPTSAALIYATPGTYTASVRDAAGLSVNCPPVQVCVGNIGTTCASPLNACNQDEKGIVQCDGSCKNSAGQLVQTPSDNGCPAPSCTIVPGTALPLAAVQSTGIGGLKPYTWSSTGINPTGAGDSYAHYYTTTGAKTVTVSGKNGASSTCKVTILAPYQTTGIHRTKQDTPRHIDYSTDYQVWAKVWDESGTESAWSPLRSASTVAGPWPTASFSWSPLQIFAGLPIQFQDKSSPQPSAWRWLFNDGTATTEVTGTGSPLYSFAREGNYTVTLEATNAAGTCSSLPAALKSGKGLPNYREVRPGSRPSPTPTSGATKP